MASTISRIELRNALSLSRVNASANRSACGSNASGFGDVQLVPTPSVNNCPIGTSRAVEIIVAGWRRQVLQRLPGQLLRGNLVVLTSRIERRRQDRHAEKRYAADFFFRGRVPVRRAPSRVWGGRSGPY